MIARARQRLARLPGLVLCGSDEYSRRERLGVVSNLYRLSPSAFQVLSGSNVVELEGVLWLIVRSTGVPAYDFTFEHAFACRHAWRIEERITAVARMGAAEDYAARFNELAELGISLVNTPEEYERSSTLPCWYPALADLTPKSVWFGNFPTPEQVEACFGWPVFVKGERQTNRHTRRQSIIESRDHFMQLTKEWRAEPVLSWQRVVCREFVPLRPVAQVTADALPKSYEFRTFWWRGQCVGIGRYWVSESYEPTEVDRRAILAIGKDAARRLNVPFLVVDVAQTAGGEWIVVEVNDGQDSGYAGVNPLVMWRRIVAIEAGGANATDSSGHST